MMQDTLHEMIHRMVEKDPGNRDEDGSRFFDEPLLGFASATDDLFSRYKTIIGPFHWTPAQVLEQVFNVPETFTGTVICWVLPKARDVRLSNRKEDTFPSRQWGRARHFGELFNNTLRREAVDILTDQGAMAAAPMLLEQWGEVPDYRNRIASKWSERHAAYAAGLGTFSINDGMITSRGIAHRVGTVVTDLVLEPTPRPYTDHRENCLLCRGLECGICIKRCPVAAISKKGHDKDRCREYLYDTIYRSKASEYGVEVVGCGLCQTKVPCEASIPKQKRPEDRYPEAGDRTTE